MESIKVLSLFLIIAFASSCSELFGKKTSVKISTTKLINNLEIDPNASLILYAKNKKLGIIESKYLTEGTTTVNFNLPNSSDWKFELIYVTPTATKCAQNGPYTLNGSSISFELSPTESVCDNQDWKIALCDTGINSELNDHCLYEGDGTYSAKIGYPTIQQYQASSGPVTSFGKGIGECHPLTNTVEGALFSETFPVPGFEIPLEVEIYSTNDCSGTKVKHIRAEKGRDREIVSVISSDLFLPLISPPNGSHEEHFLLFGLGTELINIEAPPVNPLSVAAVTDSPNQITLTWTSGEGITAGYRISYQVGATAPATCADGTTISEGSISGLLKVVAGLTAATQYSFRICAINGNETPEVSSGVTVTATTTSPMISFLPSPASFQKRPTIRIDNLTAGQTISLFSNSTCSTSLSSTTTIAGNSADLIVTTDLTGANIPLYYKIGAGSCQAAGTYNVVGTPTASGVTTNSAIISWGTNVAATSYQVLDSNDTVVTGGVSISGTSASITGLTSSANYIFKIKAIFPEGLTATSENINLTTLPSPTSIFVGENPIHKIPLGVEIDLTTILENTVTAGSIVVTSISPVGCATVINDVGFKVTGTIIGFCQMYATTSDGRAEMLTLEIINKHEVDFSSITSTPPAPFSLLRSSSSYYINSSSQAVNTPPGYLRFLMEPSWTGAMVERSVMNLNSSPTKFGAGGGWALNNSVITTENFGSEIPYPNLLSGDVVYPTKLQDSITGAISFVSKTISLTQVGKYTVSVYVKSIDSPVWGVGGTKPAGATGGSFFGFTYNGSVVSGLFNSTPVPTVHIEDAPSGFKRFSFVMNVGDATFPFGDYSFRIYPAHGPGGGLTTSMGSILVWGMQVEKSPYPSTLALSPFSSPILDQEFLKVDPITAPYIVNNSGSSGTYLIEWKKKYVGAQSEKLFSLINDANPNKEIALFFTNTNTLKLKGGVNLSSTSANYSLVNPNLSLLSFQANNFSFYHNSAEIVSNLLYEDAAGTLGNIVDFNKLYLGSGHEPNSQFNGAIKKFIYWPDKFAPFVNEQLSQP